MNPPRKSTAATRSGLRFLFRLLGWSMSAAVALVVLLYVAMPSLLRFGIPHGLSRYGITSSIESARVDIAEEKITLVGFNVGPDGGPGIRWGEVVALVDMTALLKGNIRILDIQVKDARVDLQQLASAKWDPSIAGTGAGAKPLQFDVGEAAIRDLEFIGLSEKLGRPVSLKSLKVGSVSQLNSGDRVAFELDAELGEAKLKLSGIAMMQGDLPVVEGRYELGSLALDGIPAALDMMGTSVRGRTDGAGTFTLRYQAESAVVKLDLSGRLAVSDLAFENSITALTEAGIEWDGVLELDWPVGGEPPSVRADGRAAAKRVVAGYKHGGKPLHFESDGLQFNGEVLFRKILSFTGRIDAETVRAGARETTGEWRIESNGVAVDALRHAGGDDLGIRAVSAGETRVFLDRDNVEHAASLTSLSLSNLRTGGEGYTIGSVKLESARSNAAETSSAAQWKIAGLDTGGIGISSDGRLTIAAAQLAQGQLDHSGTRVSFTDARAGGIEGSAGAAWEVIELDIASLRHRKDAAEIWSNGVALAGGRYAPDGSFAVGHLSADRVTQSSSDALDWEITSFAASGVSGTPNALRSDTVTASSFTHRVAESGEIGIDGAEISEVSYRENTGTSAARLRFDQLRYRSGDIRSVELTDAAAVAPAYVNGGGFSAKGVDAKQLLYTDDAANATQFETLSVSGVDGDVKSGVRVETARADRWRHDSAANMDIEGRALNLRAVNAAFEGALLADTAELDKLTLSLADGVNVSVAGLTVRRPKLKPADVSLAADGAGARELGVQHGANRRLSAHDVEAGRLESRTAGGYTLSFLRARRTEATDEVIGTRLDTGGLSLQDLTASAKGRIDIGRGVFERLSLSDTRGTPAASFAAKNITLEQGGVDPGRLIDLGRISMEDVNAVAGFSEFSRFVLPRAPFSNGGEGPEVDIAVTRLETRGNGSFSFFDRSTAPPFELSLFPFAASLENYHSGDPGARASFAAEGKIDEFSSLKVNGSVSQNQDSVDLKVEGKVTGFDLKRLNTYAAKHAGRAIRDGRGDATFDIEISGQRLTGDTRFVFSKVKFGPAADAALTGQGQDLSLDSAFAMLKDKDDVVKVSVPLSGSLDDPQFDFSDAVTQSVIKTVRNTVMLTFKPLGLLVSVAGLVGIRGELRFNPVSFDAGEATLTGQSLGYLDTLARELGKRPKVALKICGRAVPADLIALENAGALSNDGEPPAEQKNLAASRAAAVRQYLEQQKGIDPGRLLDCPPEVESVAGSLPRAEMLVHVEGQPQPATVQPEWRGTEN